MFFILQNCNSFEKINRSSQTLFSHFQQKISFQKTDCLNQPNFSQNYLN